jgi:predicted metalloprotease with PDZ domain
LKKRAGVVLSLLILMSVSFAQGQAPTIKIFVDASEAPRKIFHAQLTIPATPGTLTLYYPKWIPGEHAPDGPVIDLAGLKFVANGQTLKWRRDTLDGFTINVEVPAGVSEVSASLDFLSPPTMESGFSEGSSATATLAIISWNQLLLYPKGWRSDDLSYQASIRLPTGWNFGTSLPVIEVVAGQVNGPRQIINFPPVSLTMLVDSPVLAAQYLKVVPLTHDDAPVEMDIAADSAAALDAPSEVWDDYRNLVKQTYLLFGAHHYRDYHFLFTLSDHVAHFGLEHHESDDSRIGERGLVDYDLRKLDSGLLPHEYVHSWNGKYRRPADLTTPDFQQPMQDDLLWVYEGLTSYLGDVLTARSGLWDPEEYRDALAGIAARLDHEPGRTWRNLQDTADAAAQLYFAPEGWTSWRRTVDFYDEDVLNWLWVDTIIRQQTHGKKSIDDFCRLFHGAPGGPPAVKIYDFDDVISTLTEVAPYDWRAFWLDRLSNHGPGAPLTGIENSGWRLVYDQNRSELTRIREDNRREINASYSLGLLVKDDGTIVDSVEGMPAAKAGVGPGMQLIAVNGRGFARENANSAQVLRDALHAAIGSKEPIELLIENAEYFKTYKIDYHGGEKYPHLVRDESKPDMLSSIIKER